MENKITNSQLIDKINVLIIDTYASLDASARLKMKKAQLESNLNRLIGRLPGMSKKNTASAINCANLILNLE